MRRFLATLSLLLLSACYSTGRPHLRPGSDMALPRRSNLAEVLLADQLCRQFVAAGATVPSDSTVLCVFSARDTAKRSPPPRRPPKP